MKYSGLDNAVFPTSSGKYVLCVLNWKTGILVIVILEHMKYKKKFYILLDNLYQSRNDRKPLDSTTLLSSFLKKI